MWPDAEHRSAHQTTHQCVSNGTDKARCKRNHSGGTAKLKSAFSQSTIKNSAYWIGKNENPSRSGWSFFLESFGHFSSGRFSFRWLILTSFPYAVSFLSVERKIEKKDGRLDRNRSRQCARGAARSLFLCILPLPSFFFLWLRLRFHQTIRLRDNLPVCTRFFIPFYWL